MEILASPNECCQVADPHDPGTGERRTVLGFSGLSTIRGSLCPPHLVKHTPELEAGPSRSPRSFLRPREIKAKATRSPERK